MALINPTAKDAARELLRRRRARASLVDYAQAIEIPGAPVSEDPDDWLFKPIESGLALHHRVMLEAIQRAIETPFGRLMLFLPPGSAKTTYTSIVAPTWAMGKWPGYKVVNTSYADVPALRSSRRARQIVKSPLYQALWPDRVQLLQGAGEVKEWSLTNDSTVLWSGLLGGITSARADLGIIDDPVSGRQDADSEAVRRSTYDAYLDDFMTRLKPNATVILMQTRWHEDDLAGSILPEGYDGRSGPIMCRDGQVWEVLNIPAKCERLDDPLGRQIGEYLWPEWFTPRHWAIYENNPRTWASLYQQRPQPDTGGQFEKGWFEWYDPAAEPGSPEGRPANLRKYGASDYAVTKKTMENHPDYTEHGVFGIDDSGHLWALDWWSGQEATDVTIDAFLDLVKRHKPVVGWFDEAGVIQRALEPAINRRMLERQTFATVEYLTSSQDKIARVAGFRGRASARTVHLPRNTPWADRLVAQLCAFPFARYDDAVDVCGNIGRALDQIFDASKAANPAPPPPEPFTEPWFEARHKLRTGHTPNTEREFYS